MAEVETQPVRGDQGTGLAHVGAQHRTQGGVQQVGAAVVAGGIQPVGPIHLGRHGLSQGNVPLPDYAPVYDQPGHRAIGVFHRHLAVGAGNRANVALLASAFGIERRFLQHYFHALALHRMPCRRHQPLCVFRICRSVGPARLTHQNRRHHGVPDQALVTDEAGPFHSQVFVSGLYLHASAEYVGGPGQLARLLHCPVKPIHVHVETVLPGNFRGQFRREAVGVIQNEGFSAGEASSQLLATLFSRIDPFRKDLADPLQHPFRHGACRVFADRLNLALVQIAVLQPGLKGFPQRDQSLVQQARAGIHGLAKPFLFQVQHTEDEFLVLRQLTIDVTEPGQHLFGHLRQECRRVARRIRWVNSQPAPVANGPADNPPQDVTPAFVGRHDAVAN